MWLSAKLTDWKKMNLQDIEASVAGQEKIQVPNSFLPEQRFHLFCLL